MEIIPGKVVSTTSKQWIQTNALFLAFFVVLMYVRAAPADASEIGGDSVVLIAELHELSANNLDPYRAWDGRYAPWSANNPLNNRCKTIGLFSRTKRTPLK